MKLSSMLVRDLRRELDRRERGGKKLLAQQRNLSARLAKIDAELADLGMNGATSRRGPKPGRRGPGRPKGSKNKKRGKRTKNAMTLLEAILKGVRGGSTISPAKAAVAAKKAGYRTASKTLGIQVASTLAKAKEFKRTGRGAYLRVSSNRT